MNELLTVYTLAWNEEFILPYFIKHYRSRFPGCRIIIYDNFSTDNTSKVALENDCILRPFDTNNTLRESDNMAIRNYCWKPWGCCHMTWTREEESKYLERHADVKKAVDDGLIGSGYLHFINFGLKESREISYEAAHFDGSCKTEWCVVLDCDEFLDIDENILKEADFNIIKPIGYEMYGENCKVEEIDSGVFSPGWCKVCCWKAQDIHEINAGPGGHESHPTPAPRCTLKFNETPINLYHYKYISLDYVHNKDVAYSARMSEFNRINGFGIHHTYPYEKRKAYYEMLKNNKIKLR